MKLIKQTTLFYREGSSDKVYEVDLCEVGQNRYVVNFRYGRRGSSLKEGAKTVSAVALAEAQKVFNELVQSKVKKGYREVADQAATATAAAPPPWQGSSITDAGTRNQTILDYLAGRKSYKKWPLERAIWRAGELKIREAAPLLIKLIGSGKPLRDYCIAWALGLCGDQNAVSALGRLFGDSSAADSVRRIAGEALLKLSDEETSREFHSDMIEKLPAQLRDGARRGPSEAFSKALGEYLKEGDIQRFAVLDTIYLIDNEHVRPALLEILRTVPLKPNFFQRIRHIFKAAEYRRDAEVYGIIAYRFEKEKEHFIGGFDRRYITLKVDGRYEWIETKKDLESPTPKLAYGNRTREYMRKRVWRTLRIMGELGDLDYVKMAVGVLLPFSDSDAVAVKQSSTYDWNTRKTTQLYWDIFAPYHAFNSILYKNSRRYTLRDGTKMWRCRPPYKPGEPEPEVREEAFPEIWEKRPAGLLHLISESECRPVHNFAAQALRACKQFCAELDTETVIMLLERPYEVTAKLGFDLAKERYKVDSPDLDLVLALANCAFTEGRVQAHRWISEKREHFLKESNFITALVTSSRADTREFARNLLRSAVLPDAVAKALIGRLIAYLLTLDPTRADEAKDIAETILKSFGQQLRTIGIKIVLDLLAHPMEQVQELGGNILLNHETKVSEIPEEIIDRLIGSNFESIRAIGIKLFGQLPVEILIKRERLFVAFLTHQLDDIRNAIRPVVRQLATGSTSHNFAKSLVTSLIDLLLQPEKHDGVHRNLLHVLKDELNATGWMTEVGKDTTWRLLKAKSQIAQELGGLLLSKHIEWLDDIDTLELVRLNNHEIKSVREAIWAMLPMIVNRFNQSPQEMGMTVRLLDSRWDDSREFWFAAFRASFSSEDFTPGILVSICDSVREDVQKFGRDMIGTHFKDKDGQEYLLKLSEHPSADLQLFATNYLEGYAKDSPERLQELKPYFLSVLSNVNRGRIAKERVLAFLSAEAAKSEAAARIVAEILTRQSVTIAIGDKASAIEAMLGIRKVYPEVTLPIIIKEPQRHKDF